ncbi:glycoside hydrolase family 3 domain protein [Salinarchaeum sp. Harcht-Bsk1]|uniref:beta-glucosidase n=1 Tax=Salinarchaeum sp. Harcht-Bsk1 TaxID=1333523 RepID=UPI000342340F|nr:glycoside hydrolase family 3 C-terminal domain-containing protein [Salinarchaeum sp. Harcht-Bsk1]AGN01414.1 glycoside hydrolase family 3 domain protein [Salinarchaeum sp. Harcht-Bsk1]
MADTASTADEFDGAARSERVAALLEELTVGEKRVLVKGGIDPEGIATGYVPPIERLGIPDCSLVDGPMGIRAVTSTAFPATVSLAASWDPDLAERFGETIGREARGADQDVLLAPGVNIARVPQCGRNFEYYSEDPELTSALSTPMIEGVQSAGVMACVKHYAANNQETDRHEVSAEIPERALRELYLPAFEAAVTDAEVASVMAAYNRVNGTHATEHPRLLTGILREEWGFSGFTVSDWWATTDGPAAVEAGLDLDMPGMPVYEWHEPDVKLLDVLDALPDGAWFPKQRIAELLTEPWQPENSNPHVLEESHFGSELTAAIEDGRVSEADLDQMVERILGQYERFGLLDAAAADQAGTGSSDANDADPRPPGVIDADEHRDLAIEIAERGIVLLENAGVLPLDAEDLDSVALIGPHADEAKVGGGGSSEVDAVGTVTPPRGLRECLGDGVDVTVERGVDRIEMDAFTESPFPDLPSFEATGPSLADAERAASEANVAVVMVQDAATEGADRAFGLPGEQDELIERVAAAAERTVVVLKTSGAVAMPWREHVDAIVEAWYPGQADGGAVANVLCGNVDPSGRLPVTFGAATEDYPANTEERYPGRDLTVEYSEGVFVGYRHFDDADVEPLYPFGHGESYAEFEYGDVTASLDGSTIAEADASADDASPNDASAADGSIATVSATVENVADRGGWEVVQCYLSPPGDAIDRPPRELVAFESVPLDAGESRTVELPVDRRAFAYYDEDAAEWAIEDGEHTLSVGRSSRDRRASATVTLGE